MKRRPSLTKNSSLLSWFFLLFFSCSLLQADERQASECRAALDGTADMALSIDDKRLVANAVLEACGGIDDPELRARDAVIRSQRIGSWASMRTYLQDEVDALVEAKGADFPFLVELYEQLITATLEDDCDVGAAEEWFQRAAALRQRHRGNRGDVQDLSAEGNWRFSAGVCYSKLGEDKKATTEFRAAEQLARRVLSIQIKVEEFDVEQRMLAIDLLRITLERLDSALDQSLFDEYEQLMDELNQGDLL